MGRPTKELGSGFDGDVAQAFANQVDYCRAMGAPVTARIVAAVAQLLTVDDAGAFVARVRDWPGVSPLGDGLPLRTAAALHSLHIRGVEPALAAIYADAAADDAAIVGRVLRDRAAELMPWLDGPPQTNEAGRSANFVAAMLWLVGRGSPTRFECLEIGSSAGINLMIDLYRYNLGGVAVGPREAVITLTPEWTGSPPPAAGIVIAPPKGCDITPIDLLDPAQALRLKAYVWPEHEVRFARLEAAIAAARFRAPNLVRMNAADFVERELARPQADGTTRVLMHSIVWQYLPADEQRRIEAAMAAAGAGATHGRALAWVAVEVDRTLLGHTLAVRYWPNGGEADGGGEWTTLARAHAHGATIDWMA